MYDCSIISTLHPARNPRVVKEASALVAAGRTVEVLTLASHAPSLALDRALATAGGWSLHYAADLTGTLHGRRQAVLQRCRVRLARELNCRLGFGLPDALGPVRPLLRAARLRPARLRLAHVEGGLWVAAALRRDGELVSADFEDWYSEDLPPADRRHLPLQLLRQTEQTMLHQAAFTTAPSAAMADALQARYGGRRPLVITNSFPLQPRPATDTISEPPVLFWFSQTLGPGLGLEAFLNAWSRTQQPSRLVLLGADHSGTADRLRLSLPASFRDRLTVLSPVPPDDLPALIARHDLGLALEDAAIPSRDLTITNKILQYLNAGLAVVATGTAGQREVLAGTDNAGIVINPSDPGGTARQLDELLGDRSALLTARGAARRLAETTYCWELEAPKLIALVSAALAGPA